MISIIIPFYNEEKNIPILLQEIENVMKENSRSYEVLLVDDGSEKKIQSASWRTNSITLIQHKKRLGKGEALKTGLLHAKGDVIVFMDGDLQDDPHDLPLFFD